MRHLTFRISDSLNFRILSGAVGGAGGGELGNGKRHLEGSFWRCEGLWRVRGVPVLSSPGPVRGVFVPNSLDPEQQPQAKQ